MSITQISEDRADGRQASVAAELARLVATRTAPLPYSLRIVLENLIRNSPTDERALILEVAAWRPGAPGLVVPLAVDRVVLPDSSGLPVLMDFAALRDALLREGGDPARAEPQIQCDLVVDHSLIVDQAGHPGRCSII
ncbi:hypothetical protein [Gemmobacter sp. 24YEA27]|uniref:hypothetical protein n=1 Tax=Gemmobacter sp. 24YEA27 TaxID=3040672 RepID=UPI0024B3643B|nr:hypothetical protein [Gemmobacter sp. 24YEA27]